MAFAAALSLDSADKATVGVNATSLQAALHIGKSEIGLLLTVSSLVGAAATIPAGALVDRVRRTRLLSGTILVWAVAMCLSGAATSYLFLVLARVALGAVTAVAAPAIASMIGDVFPAGERGRIYGFVLSGELIGAGFGFVVAGQFTSLSWRAPFLFLAVPSLLVWWLIRRLPEPPRGERDHPVDDGPPTTNLLHAVREVLRVRTNVVLIVASALGYFFFSGVRGFGVELAQHHYGISQNVASMLTVLLGAGALGGVLTGGRLADRLFARGRLAARVEVPGTTVLVAGALFVPALLITKWWLALPLLVLAAWALGMSNPPLDAARLDIMRPALWGRAEAVRSVLRSSADAAAPLLFGVVSSSVFAGSESLRDTFLLMLSTLAAASVIVLRIGRRTYPRDRRDDAGPQPEADQGPAPG